MICLRWLLLFFQPSLRVIQHTYVLNNERFVVQSAHLEKLTKIVADACGNRLNCGRPTRCREAAETMNVPEADEKLPQTQVPQYPEFGAQSWELRVCTTIRVLAFSGWNWITRQGNIRRSFEVKFKSWTAGIAVLTLATAPVFAEDSLAQWSYDQMVTPVGCCDDGCCGDGCDCGDGCGCGSGVGGGGLLSGMGPGWVEGFSLAGTLGIESIDVGGWTQFGGTSEPTLLGATAPGGAPVSGAGSASFNNIEDRINLHQQYFYVGKAADGSRGIDLGFRADFVYGIDAQDTQSFGNPANSFDFGGDFNHGIYGWAIPQLYGEVAMGDFSVIVGHFYTLVGYEVVTAPDNFFFSHALTQYNSEPFTHTGVLGTYSGFENLTLYGGWTLGWDTGFDNLNSGNNFLGGFSASLSDAVTLTYINTYGNFGAINQGEDDDYGHSIVVDVALTDSLNYVFQSDYKHVSGGPVRDEDIGINQYLIYSFNDILSFGSRIEWWRAEDTTTGDRMSHYGYTSGVNIKLLDNLVMRPEFRQDWIPALDYDEEIAACDMILTY